MTVGVYTRVSTLEQHLERQLEGVAECASRELDAGADDLRVFCDKSTGTDVDRSGYHDLVGAVEDRAELYG